MRHKHTKPVSWVAWFASLALLVPLVAVGAPALDQAVQDRLCALEALHGVEDPSCQPTTTTSTSTSTTSSTTSTTTSSTTTTSVPTVLVIPPTQQQTIPGFNSNESFRIQIACITTETVQCDLNAGGKRNIADFDYLAHGMPYLYPEAQPGMHQHAWWVSGDREGYRCAYGFMYDQHPNPFGVFSEPRPAEFIARFSIVRPTGQGYGKVNDTYMEEGQRYYDGTVANEGGMEISEDCQQAALEPGFDYDGYVPHGPDDIRVGLFRSDGAIADIRDFTDVNVLVPGHFEFVSLEDGRAQIVFVLGANNKVSHVFYYDTMNSGLLAVEVNGVTLQDS